MHDGGACLIYNNCNDITSIFLRDDRDLFTGFRICDLLEIFNFGISKSIHRKTFPDLKSARQLTAWHLELQVNAFG